eukprot:gene30114-37602_t
MPPIDRLLPIDYLLQIECLTPIDCLPPLDCILPFDSVLLNGCLPPFVMEGSPAMPATSVEVVLLDPVVYPAALKAFAREVCKNDILNFGRLHFFFPDSRIALDLNTD